MHTSMGYMPAGGEMRGEWFDRNVRQLGFETTPGTIDVEAGVPLRHRDPTARPWHHPPKPLPSKRRNSDLPLAPVILTLVGVAAAALGMLAR